MKFALSGFALLVLVSCGAAGDPLKPRANLGVSIGPNGVSPSASVGASNGPFNIGLNL